MHRKAKGIELMIMDCLLEADQVLHFTDDINDPELFLGLNDSILQVGWLLCMLSCAACWVQAHASLPSDTTVLLGMHAAWRLSDAGWPYLHAGMFNVV